MSSADICLRSAPDATSFPDGIFGLSFPALSKFNQPSFFSVLIKYKKVTKNQFGIYLTKSQEGSELYFGGTNANKYTGAITWYNTVASSPAVCADYSNIRMR